MFCRKCGTPLADDAKFCGKCGTATANAAAPVQNAAPVVPTVEPTYAAPQAPAPTYTQAPAAAPINAPTPVAPAATPTYVAPQAPAPTYTQAPTAAPVYTPTPVPQKEPNPMFAKFVSIITQFWKSPTASVAESTKSNTHEWSLLAAIGVLLYALSNSIIGVASMGGYYPFLPMLGIGILVGAAAYGLASLGVWVLVTQIFKKQATFIQALNVTAVALLPLAAIQVVNILVGLIYSPLVTAFTVSALIMSAMLLYIGIQKFDKLEKSPFYAYSIMAAAVVVSVSLVSLLYDLVLQSAMTVGNIIGSFF